MVQGFTQVHGLNFFDTYAPVAKMSSVRLVLAIAALLDLELHQLDVDTAFLQAPVKERIYMAQPQGFRVGKHKVCKLLKSVYGLKQSPRNWNHLINKSRGGACSLVATCTVRSAIGRRFDSHSPRWDFCVRSIVHLV